MYRDQRVELLVATSGATRFVPGTVVSVALGAVNDEIAARCDVLTDDGRFWPARHPLSMRPIVTEAA